MKPALSQEDQVRTEIVTIFNDDIEVLTFNIKVDIIL